MPSIDLRILGVERRKNGFDAVLPCLQACVFRFQGHSTAGTKIDIECRPNLAAAVELCLVL